MRVWSDSTVPWPGYLTINTYEDGFLTLAEQRITGTLNVVSAAMWGMRWVVVRVGRHWSVAASCAGTARPSPGCSCITRCSGRTRGSARTRSWRPPAATSAGSASTWTTISGATPTQEYLHVLHAYLHICTYLHRYLHKLQVSTYISTG